jgi:phosphoglycolate phosphatase-like HAD superfamily hydrolase
LLVPVLDLDGTLIDSDAALAAPFTALGIPLDAVTFGQPLADECARLGVTVEDYLAHYDTSAALAFPGVEELVAALDRWAVCSNKRGDSGRAELARLGWAPDVALFSDDFGGAKQLGPVLDALGLGPSEVLFVGDTEHDRACAHAVGCRFAIATWNPRAVAEPGDEIVRRPTEVLALLR